MDTYLKVIMVLLLSSAETEADVLKLVNRLSSKEWPWFGFRYPKRCPKSEEDWPKCYNPRGNIRTDVLKRNGINYPKPEFELEVIFSAPSETLDICGKSTTLPEVKPFQLNANGLPISELLNKGAEIYRKMPIVKWKKPLTEQHSLMFIDSGFLKVRGYIGNISTNGTHLLGEILWPYTPPANPVPFRNPIVILMIEETLIASAYNQEQLFNRQCFVRGISKTTLRDCLGYYLDVMSGAKVKAVQVFYTDGSSLYEKSRACQEGSFCDQECLDNYQTYVTEKASSVQFMTVPASDINMYVNLDLISVRRFNYTAGCKFVVVEPYTFRAVPGDNNMVDDTAKLHQPYRIEFSGSGEAALDVSTYYSVLMVDPDAAYPEAKKLPYGHLWIANLKYQDHYSTGNEIMKYAGPTPSDNKDHTYYILLFSHQNTIEALPSNFSRETPACKNAKSRRCMWDFSKLPSDFNLRGITWFRAQTDNFTLELLTRPGGDFQVTGQPPPRNCQPQVVAYKAVPQMAISLTYEGTALVSEDPKSPDFDYDFSTRDQGNSLSRAETACFIAFFVRLMVEIIA